MDNSDCTGRLIRQLRRGVSRPTRMRSKATLNSFQLGSFYCAVVEKKETKICTYVISFVAFVLCNIPYAVLDPIDATVQRAEGAALRSLSNARFLTLIDGGPNSLLFYSLVLVNTIRLPFLLRCPSTLWHIDVFTHLTHRLIKY